MLEIPSTFCSILGEEYTQKRQNANVMQVFIIVCLYIARLLRTYCAKASPPPPGGELLPYAGYIGMCGPKGFGFSAAF